MALDEPREDDTVFTEDGITYIVNKSLYERVKPIKVDFVDTAMGAGFTISSDLQKSCGTCSC